MSNYQVMPELTDEEYSELKADIERRGVMIPIEYDELGNVLDGYHRLKICGELGIKDFPKVIRAGMSESEKLTHARKLNMARRQLTGEQRRELIRDQLRATPEQSDRQIAQALGVHHTTVSSQRKELEASGDVAKLATSTDTLGREQPRCRKPAQRSTGSELAKTSIPEHGDNDDFRPCESEVEDNQEPQAQSELDTTEIPHKFVTVFNPTKREETAMKNPEVVARMQETGTNAVNAEKQLNREAKAGRKAYELVDEMPEENCRLFTADIRDGLKEIADNSVDVIITDPPYGKEYISLYGELSKLARRVLKPTGSLVVMTGQSYLPEVMSRLGQYMSYHWTMCYLTPGGKSPQMFQKKVNTFWKPVLWYVKDGYESDYVGDVLKSPVNANEKDYHAWGQSLGGMLEIVERLSYPEDVILDPFLGGGTTGVAALVKGRKFIGTDIEPGHVEISRERIKERYDNARSKTGTNTLAR
ncbi:MAG: ParB N-terminal domain-containing protein [Synergistaceae bacterium]|nr:ParB N-terminal domain-containing protein [Synergistaceae bacterium]